MELGAEEACFSAFGALQALNLNINIGLLRRLI